MAPDEELALASADDGPHLPRRCIVGEVDVAIVVLQIRTPMAPDEDLAVASADEGPRLPVPGIGGEVEVAIVVLQVLAQMAFDEHMGVQWNVRTVGAPLGVLHE